MVIAPTIGWKVHVIETSSDTIAPPLASCLPVTITALFYR